MIDANIYILQKKILGIQKIKHKYVTKQTMMKKHIKSNKFDFKIKKIDAINPVKETKTA